jgi:hypothetical protein
MSTQVSLDFRNDLMDLKSPYRVRFPINSDILRLKLQSCQIPAITHLGHEPYIYLRIEEIDGDYLMPNSIKAFGKLILVGDRQGYLYYQPDLNSCDISFGIQQNFKELTLQFCDYQGLPIHLEDIQIAKKVRCGGGGDRLKLHTEGQHGLKVNDIIRMDLQTTDSVVTKGEIKVKSVPSLKTFTIANPGHRISSKDNMRIFRKHLNCSLSFQTWAYSSPLIQKSIQLIPLHPLPSKLLGPLGDLVEEDFVEVNSAIPNNGTDLTIQASQPSSRQLVTSSELTLPLQCYPQHKQRDSYSILGLKSTATHEEVKAKYQELYLLYHPGHSECADNDWFKFLDLQLAYASILNGSAQSALPDFERLTEEYRDGEKHRDLGYAISPDDFVRENGDDTLRLRHKFDVEFESVRSDKDKETHTKFKDFTYPESYLKHEFTSAHIPHILSAMEHEMFHDMFIGEAIKACGIPLSPLKTKKDLLLNFDQVFNGINLGGMCQWEYKSQPAPVSLNNNERSLFDLNKPAITDLCAQYCKNPEKIDTDLVNLITKVRTTPDPVYKEYDKSNFVKIQQVGNEDEDLNPRKLPHVVDSFGGRKVVANAHLINFSAIFDELNQRIGNTSQIYPIGQFKCVYDHILLQELTENPLDEDSPPDWKVFEQRLLNKMIEAILLNQVTPTNIEGEGWLVV